MFSRSPIVTPCYATVARWTSPGPTSRPSAGAGSTRSIPRPTTSTSATSRSRSPTSAASAGTPAATTRSPSTRASSRIRCSSATATRYAARWGLLHDASEAYLVDLPHPIKHRSELGRLYRAAEERLEQVIRERFGLLGDPPPRLKEIDRAVLATERATLTMVAWHWPELEGVEPLELRDRAVDARGRRGGVPRALRAARGSAHPGSDMKSDRIDRCRRPRPPRSSRCTSTTRAARRSGGASRRRPRTSSSRPPRSRATAIRSSARRAPSC